MINSRAESMYLIKTSEITEAISITYEVRQDNFLENQPSDSSFKELY